MDLLEPSRALDAAQRDAGSVVEVSRHRARHYPDDLAYTFLIDGESAKIERTYAQMDRWARAIAARLQEIGAGAERALLIYDPGLDYVAALVGCLYAGVVAVPAYPPDPMRMQRTLPRLQRIVQDCQAEFVLTTAGAAFSTSSGSTVFPRKTSSALRDRLGAGFTEPKTMWISLQTSWAASSSVRKVAAFTTARSVALWANFM